MQVRLFLAAMALLVVAHPSGAAPSSGRCASVKAKAIGLRVAASLVCHATATRKGVAVSSACLDGARKKFERGFAKAAKKGACGAPGDAASIGGSVDAFTADAAADLLPAGSPDGARRCAARKMLRAGAYGRGRLACWARAFKGGVPVDSQCFGGSAAKLVVGFRAAEAKPGCATAGDAASIEGAVSAFVDGIAAQVSPATTTTTTVVGTSTTVTLPGGGTSSTIAGVPTTSTTSTTSPGHVSFLADVQPIFTANCALSGCHSGVTPEEGLDLSPGYSFPLLRNVDSHECPQFKRVKPGRPNESYLVFKIEGPPQPCFDGERMPKDAAPLSAKDQATIRAWITQGALSR